MKEITSQRGASDSITDFSMVSYHNYADNPFCLGLFDRDICPKSKELGTYNA